MALNEWRGDAMEVAQVDTLTIGGTPAAGNKVRVTINRKFVEYTFVTADTTALMAAGLQILLNACPYKEFQEVTWSYPGSGSVVTATSKVPGRPFTMTASATGGGATNTKASVTASTGPSHGAEATNWSLGTLPADGQDILIRQGADVLYDVATVFAHDFASFKVAATFTGSVGLPYRNDSDYVEYRDRYAVLGNAGAIPYVEIGGGLGQGPKLVNLSLYGGDAIVVYGTGSRVQVGTPTFNFITRTANTATLEILGGETGIACEPDQTGRVLLTHVVNGQLTVGGGATVDEFDFDGGVIDAYGTTTLLGLTNGTYTQHSGTLTNIESDGGKVVLRHEGTVTSANFRGQGGVSTAVCDCSLDGRDRVFTDASFTGGASLLDPNFTVAFTNPATFDAASLAASNLGKRFLVQRVPV